MRLVQLSQQLGVGRMTALRECLSDEFDIFAFAACGYRHILIVNDLQYYVYSVMSLRAPCRAVRSLRVGIVAIKTLQAIAAAATPTVSSR